MLDAVESTSRLTNQLINGILNQMEATLEHGRLKIKWYNKDVNELLFSQPYVRPHAIGNLLNISSRTTLTKYFSELTAAGIVYPSKNGKEVFYVNNDLIAILEG